MTELAERLLRASGVKHPSAPYCGECEKARAALVAVLRELQEALHEQGSVDLGILADRIERGGWNV